jgi:hypothetical protein
MRSIGSTPLRRSVSECFLAKSKKIGRSGGFTGHWLQPIDSAASNFEGSWPAAGATARRHRTDDDRPRPCERRPRQSITSTSSAGGSA